MYQICFFGGGKKSRNITKLNIFWSSEIPRLQIFLDSRKYILPNLVYNYIFLHHTVNRTIPYIISFFYLKNLRCYLPRCWYRNQINILSRTTLINHNISTLVSINVFTNWLLGSNWPRVCVRLVALLSVQRPATHQNAVDRSRVVGPGPNRSVQVDLVGAARLFPVPVVARYVQKWSTNNIVFYRLKIY